MIAFRAGDWSMIPKTNRVEYLGIKAQEPENLMFHGRQRFCDISLELQVFINGGFINKKYIYGILVKYT